MKFQTLKQKILSIISILCLLILFIIIASYSSINKESSTPDKDSSTRTDKKPIEVSYGMMGEIIEINPLLKELTIQEINPMNPDASKSENKGLFGIKKIKAQDAIFEKLYLGRKDENSNPIPEVAKIKFSDLEKGARISVYYNQRKDSPIEDVKKITWIVEQIMDPSLKESFSEENVSYNNLVSNSINNIPEDIIIKKDLSFSINFLQIEEYDKTKDELKLKVDDVYNSFSDKGEEVLKNPYKEEQVVGVSLEKVNVFLQSKEVNENLPKEESVLEAREISKSNLFNYLENDVVTKIVLNFEELPDINKILKPKAIIIFTTI